MADSKSFCSKNIVQQGKAAAAFMGVRDLHGGSILFVGGFANGGDEVSGVEELLRAEFDEVIANGVH